MPRIATRIQYDDGSFQDIGPGSIIIPTPPVPAPYGLIRGGYFDGVPLNQTARIAIDFGMTWVRCWIPIRSWDVLPVEADLQRIKDLKEQGVRVLAVFTPLEKTGAPPANPQQAANWFKAAVSLSAVYLPDAWEIGNEQNLSTYNSDYAAHASSWITAMLFPAYTILKGAGQFVVSGGWSENTGDALKYAISKGVLNYCDSFGFHPYGTTALQHVGRVATVRSLIGDKPLWLTEWNGHFDAKNPASWMDELKLAATGIKGMAQAVFHFRTIATAQPAGVAGPLDADLNQRPIWYAGTKAALNALG